MSEFAVEEMLPAIEKQIKDSPSGVYCRFIVLNKTWALKLYRVKRTRDESYELQRRAAEIGLGPEVAAIIDLSKTVEKWESYKYGFITEIIETVESRHDRVYFDAWDWANTNRLIIRPIMAELKEKLGWNFNDHHGKNWGYKNDKLMPLDFGPTN